MKTFPSSLAFLLVALMATLAQTEPALLAEPPDGSEVPAPEVRAVFKPAVVEETTVTRQGGRDVIVQRLALDPDDSVQPAVAADSIRHADPEAPSAAEAGSESAPPVHFHLLSATVHPGPLTFLSWTHVAAYGTARNFSGWSNIDFNHFTGVTAILGTDGREHSFMLAIGTDSDGGGDLRSPSFPSDTPTFLPDQADMPAEALVLIASLHRIYAKDASKLAAAHAGREAAQAAREAELLADPAEPQDLIIRYRIAETPLPAPSEGGAP